MADVTIDATALSSGFKLGNRSTVFISTTTGYHFFVSSVGDLVYRKTTDNGATWGARVTIRAGAATVYDVWYDKWTPGDTGTLIHICFQDSGTDDQYYASIDTANSDTLVGPVALVNGTAYAAATGTWTTRCCTISKARGGNLYIYWTGDGSASANQSGFYRSVDAGVNWTSRTSPYTTVASGFQLYPANTSDTQDMLTIQRGTSASVLNLSAYVYDDSANAQDLTAIVTLTAISTEYFQLAGSVRASDNHVLIAVWDDYNTITNDLRIFDLNPSANGASGVTIVEKTNVFGGGVGGLSFAQCTICIDQNSNDLYVGYLDGLGTGWETDAQVVYKKSTDGGATWGTQIRYDVTIDDERALWCDLGGTSSRFEITWFNIDLVDMFTNADNSIAISAAAINLNWLPRYPHDIRLSDAMVPSGTIR